MTETPKKTYLGGCLHNQFFQDGKILPFSCSSEGYGYIRDSEGVSTGYYIAATGIIYGPDGLPTDYRMYGGILSGPTEIPPWVQE